MHYLGLCSRHRQHFSLQSTDHIQHHIVVSWTTRSSTGFTNLVDRISAFLLIFIEIPLLLRICPTSAKFDAIIRQVTTNYMRAAVYGVMSLVQWLSLVVRASSLIAAAIVLLAAAAFYALAGLKHQDFVGSKTLGGQGVAQMIV